MKRTVWIWQLVGFAITSIVGTLLHFLYDFTNKSVWVAPFSGVNESTFEHMKLLFWPMLIFAVIESFFFRGYSGFWWIKLFGISLGPALIPILFYTYNGAIGKSPDLVNIAIFLISAALAYIFEARLLKRNFTIQNPRFAICILCIFGLMFTVFTFRTPRIGIFEDPITHLYGL